MGLAPMGLAPVGLGGLLVPVQLLPQAIGRGTQARAQRLVALLQGQWSPLWCSTPRPSPPAPRFRRKSAPRPFPCCGPRARAAQAGRHQQPFPSSAPELGPSPALARGRRLGGSFAPWPWPMPFPVISPPFRCCSISSSGASVGGCCWCHGRAPRPWCCLRSGAKAGGCFTAGRPAGARGMAPRSSIPAIKWPVASSPAVWWSGSRPCCGARRCRGGGRSGPSSTAAWCTGRGQGPLCCGASAWLGAVGIGPLATGSWVPPKGSAQASPVCGAASRIGPGPLRGSLTPPRRLGSVQRCAIQAHTLSHPHLHRRRWLEGFDLRFLLVLSEACADRSLPRLGELVDEVLFQLWSQLPPAPVDPELEKLVPC